MTTCIQKLLLPITALMLSQHLEAQRTTVSIDDNWIFQNQESVNLPHTWNTDAYHQANYDQGEKTYTRHLYLKDPPGDNRYFLRVDAASKSAKVYINGQQTAMHHGGYTAFQADITPYVHQGDNQLQLVVNNADSHIPPISADFTFMGGVYRHVWLITTSAQHFAITDDGRGGVKITPHLKDAQQAKFNVDYQLANQSSTTANLQLVVKLLSPEKQLLSTTLRDVKLQGNSITHAAITLPVKAPRLWSPDQPNLYTIVTQLIDRQGRVIDEEEHNPAFRKISFDANQGMTLNGKPLKLRGVSLHQDQYPVGVAKSDDMQRRDLALIKQMGANFVRLAHYPQSEVLLDECDRLGLMVWEEIPMVNYVPDDSLYTNIGKQNLREMIRQHYNHPSVILWGYMNEILLRMNNVFKGPAVDSAIRRTVKLAHEMENIVHQEDPSRHSAMAVHGSDIYNKYQLTDIPQVVGWNLYQGWYGGRLPQFDDFLERQHREHPTHPIIVSEWGAGSDLRLHADSTKAFDFSMEYQQKFIEHYLPVIEDKPFVAGGAYWNFIDFSSAERQESMPYINNKGLLTIDRRVKDIYYYFQSYWRNDIPVVHIATRDWPEREAKSDIQKVKVYSNQDRIQLFVNGKDQGIQPTYNRTASFNVTWREGKNIIEAKTPDGTVQDVATIHFTQAATMPMKVGQHIAVNVGSHATYQSPTSLTTWLPDQSYQAGSWGYTQGTPTQTQGAIACTRDTPLLQTMMTENPIYRFDVGPGSYELQLQWVDQPKAANASSYLLGKESGNQYQAHIMQTTVRVEGTSLDIVPATWGLPPTLSAIQIRRVQ